MGDTFLTLGEVEGAINHIKRALKIHETAYGPNHLDIATDLNNLGAALRRDGDLAGARESFQRALGISEAALGPWPRPSDNSYSLEQLGQAAR